MPRPARVIRTEAIILRRHDLGEADRIITLFTPDHGKIKAVGKGIRRPKSKLAGHLETFMRSDLLIAKGRSLDVITQAEMVEGYLPLRENLRSTTYASHFVELVDGFTPENDENRSFYILLAAGLAWLTVTGDIRRTARFFEVKLLDVAGYRPQLFNCVLCGVKLAARPQFFSAKHGGAACPACAAHRGDVTPISLNGQKVLRYMQKHPFEALEQVTLSDTVHAELERILHYTLSYYLERRLHTVDFLRQMRRETGEAL